MPDGEAVASSAQLGPVAARAADGSLRRRFVSAGHVLLVGVVCFSLWTFFGVRQLANSANASPLGVRRGAAWSIRRPIARLEESLGSDRVINGGSRALGGVELGTPGGAVTPSAAPTAGGKTGHRTSKPVPPKGPPPLKSPTTAKPMTILEIGDSLGEDLGFGLADELGGDLRVHLLQNAVGDTGLSNVGYFNWPATLAQQLWQYHPQLVVVFLGGNDWQGFIANGQVAFTGTKLWTSVYTQRVDELMSEATAAGAHVLWVGLPIMQDPTFGSHMAYLNAIYLSQAKRYRDVVFIPTWKLFSNSAGQYAEFLPNASGSLIEVRDSDGIHIDPPGGTDLLGDYVVSRIEGIWHIRL
jgi:lysophospholipase L1-like esterase